MPNKNSVICSAHFVGNRRSHDPKSPSYIPTIFPKVHGKDLKNHQLQQNPKYDRGVNRKRLIVTQNKSKNTVNQSYGSFSVCTQVAFDVPSNNFIFSCDFNGRNACTQVSIPKSCMIVNKPLMVEKSCGSDPTDFRFSKLSFHGFNSIISENSLQDLTGTNFEMFNFLLSMLPPSLGLIISKENTLLICLMKLKLGLTDLSLSAFFSIHKTTAAKVFVECLLVLSLNCKKLICWPSKSDILESLPEVLKQHYPNCRCIIKCIEIKAEQPTTKAQRLNMYSMNKGGYTIKVLIGITPTGSVSFLSRSYGGSASDSYITYDSGFLDKIKPGDQILANKGFSGIETGVDNPNNILVINSLPNNGILSQDDLVDTFNVASIRIHIDQLFDRLKRFNILNEIPSDLLLCIDNVLLMCCALLNLNDLVQKHRSLVSYL